MNSTTWLQTDDDGDLILVRKPDVANACSTSDLVLSEVHLECKQPYNETYLSTYHKTGLAVVFTSTFCKLMFLVYPSVLLWGARNG